MRKIICLLIVIFIIIFGISTFGEKTETNIPLAYTGNSEAIIEDMQSQSDIAVERAYAAANPDTSVVSALGYVVVTDYIKNDGTTDVADEIQNIIDSNPNRTIYFPDGVYVIGKSICTPANPSKSVDLQLSNYAVIKAAESWQENEAMIRLGGKDAANDTHTAGSNYSLTGGVIDGSGKANAVSIDSGRESRISNLSIKNAVKGIHIKYGANSGSSDADISDVNIIGTGGTNSTGILIEGFDNTLTNIRIGNVFIGVHLKSASNSMRNIHPLYYSDYTDYENSCGFYDECGNNIYDFCYSDQFCNGFRTVGNISNIYDNCFCFWYTEAGGKEVAFRADGRFDSAVTNFRAGFRDDTENAVLIASDSGGNGVFDNLLVNKNIVSDKSYRRYKEGGIKWFINCIFN
ncbi:MAG: hypothetical protein E7516_01965 [Ruminococcaceae bacterium]|nr:hypothetical protein [Oscillospiraceae bacterium]